MSDEQTVPNADKPTPPFMKMFVPGVAIGFLTALFIGYGDRFIDREYGNPIIFVYPCVALGGFVAGWFTPHSGGGLVVWTFIGVLVGGGILGGGEFFVIDLIGQSPAFLGEWAAWRIAGWLAHVSGVRAYLMTPKAGRFALSAIVLGVVALVLWEGRNNVSGDPPDVRGYADGWEHFVPRPKPWSLPIGERVGGPVAIDGAVFATANGILYGINSNGVGRWMLPGAITAPAVGNREDLYVGLRSGVARVDITTGRIRWIADTPIEPPLEYGDDNRRQLSVGPSGTLYVNPRRDVIHAINPDGTMRWSFREEYAFIGAPIEGPDNRVYVAHTSRHLSVLAIDSGGQEVWRRSLYGSGAHGVSVGSDVISLIGSPYVYALRHDGTIKWRRKFGQAVYETAVDPHGRVFASTGDWVALDADGRALFGPIDGGPPAFAGDLTILASHALSAYARDGRTAYQMEGLWPTSEYHRNQTVVGPDGMLYVQLPTRLLGMRSPTKP